MFLFLMAKEKSLVFIKPEHADVAEEVFEFLEKGLGGGFERIFDPFHISNPPKEVIEEHYKHVKHVPSFKETLDLFLDKGIVLGIYTGEDIINRIRKIVGATCPSEAEKGTIRAKYGKGSLKESDEKGTPLHNVIHASGSPEEAEKELKIWEKVIKQAK